jgi:hypothetical protein
LAQNRVGRVLKERTIAIFIKSNSFFAVGQNNHCWCFCCFGISKENCSNKERWKNDGER